MNDRTKYVITMLLLAFSFIMLVVEVRTMHQFVMRRDSAAYIPMVYGLVAAIAALAGISTNRTVRSVTTVVFIAGIAVGVIGFMRHTENQPAKALSLLKPFGVNVAPAHSEEDDEHEEERGEAPYLPPLSIAGLATIAAVQTWPKARRRSSD